VPSRCKRYWYNANGAKKSFTGPDGSVYAYTYDSGNRLSSIDIPNVGQITPGENGNMTGKADAGQERTYIYDVEDRLVRVQDGSTSVIAGTTMIRSKGGCGRTLTGTGSISYTLMKV
jgi:YD repeat-containing protein